MVNPGTELFRYPKTIVTIKDLALIWQESNENRLKSKICYYVKNGLLIRLWRGIFAKNTKYNPLELAASIYRPSYISFETVLRQSGIIFQHYDTVFLAGRWSKTIHIDKHTFVFRKLKDSVLFNPTGIICETYSIAGPERAFMDMIYIFPEYYFDNLQPLNWEKCFEIANIYQNRQLIKRLNKYYKNHAK